MTTKPLSLLSRLRLAGRILSDRNITTAAPSGKKTVPFAWPDFRQNNPYWRMIDPEAFAREGYQTNAIIFASLRYKQDALAQPRMRYWAGDEKNREALPPTDPIQRLLLRPNFHQSQVEFFQQAITYFNIAGNNFTCIDRGPSQLGEPVQLFNLRPDRVFMLPKDDAIIGYWYVPESHGIKDGVPILAEDMLVVKLPNPNDPFEGQGFGWSPLAASAQSVDVDNDISRFLKVLFQDGPQHSFLLKWGGSSDLDDEQIDRVRDRWMAQYGGVEKWIQPAILNSSWELDKVGMTPEEFAFTEVDARTESRIVAPLGVPPALLSLRFGSQDSSLTKDMLMGLRQIWWEDRFTSELTLFADEFGRLLNAGNRFVAWDFSTVPAMQDNVVEQVATALQLIGTGMPPNQAYNLVGIQTEPIPFGDNVYIDQSFAPLDMETGLPINLSIAQTLAESQQNNPPVPPPTEVAPDTNIEGESSYTPQQWKSIVEGVRLRQNMDIKVGIARKVNEVAESHETQFRRTARQQLENDHRQVRAMLASEKRAMIRESKSINFHGIQTAWQVYMQGAGRDNWRQAFIPRLTGVILENNMNIATNFGLAFNQTNFFASDWFNEYTLTFADNISTTSERQLNTLLMQAQRDGASIQSIENEIDNLFQQWIEGGLSVEDFQFVTDRLPSHRVETIARTETMRASVSGQDQLYRINNIQAKEWLATNDDRTRPTHIQAWSNYTHGGRYGSIPIDEPFLVGGCEMMFPLEGSCVEEIANCRCVHLPVVVEGSPTASPPPSTLLPIDS